MTAFHEVLFPLDISLKSAGGPQRRTDVVLLGSGAEERNARWAHSRRRYDAGYGVKTFDALSQVIAFFEERRGRLYGFRWRDRLDHSSAAPGLRLTDRSGHRDWRRGHDDVPTREDLRLGLLAVPPADFKAGSGQRAHRGGRQRAGRAARRSRRHHDRGHQVHAGTFRRATRRLQPGSCSTCRCVSIRTISESICRLLRRARSQRIPLVEMRP